MQQEINQPERNGKRTNDKKRNQAKKRHVMVQKRRKL